MLTESLKSKIIKFLETKIKAGNWDIIGSEIESRESIIYRFSNELCDQDFALKVYRPLYTKEHISHIYSVQKKYSDKLNSSNSLYQVPSTVSLFLDDNCYLMEWITGTTLREQLWKNCLNKKSLQKHIKDATLWVKTYHQVANLKMRQVDTSFYLNSLKNHSNRSNALKVTNSNIFKSGAETLANYSQTFVGFETLHADIHGDLHLSNLIKSDSKIDGIDIKAKKHLPIENDLTQMLNYICINYFNMLTRFDIRKPQATWEIFNVVLDAYGYTKDKKSREFFLFIFLYQMLFRWVHVENTHSTSKDKTMVFYLLGKWRHYNSFVIIKNLTTIINAKMGKTNLLPQ